MLVHCWVPSWGQVGRTSVARTFWSASHIICLEPDAASMKDIRLDSASVTTSSLQWKGRTSLHNFWCCMESACTREDDCERSQLVYPPNSSRARRKHNTMKRYARRVCMKPSRTCELINRWNKRGVSLCNHTYRYGPKSLYLQSTINADVDQQVHAVKRRRAICAVAFRIETLIHIDKRRKWAGYLCCSAKLSIRHKEKLSQIIIIIKDFDRKHHKISSVPVENRIEDRRVMIMDLMVVTST
ncbi:hypothetical protein RvY_04889 [Ramazzottius varieornatus]|uniref:Uncharacterized protein n=1 Tax=Ramazzottius varieornatus TaxID=947166 RepID=A0A1D1V2B3_RAMVA|nr:hypothetical protein RvY_04889 [Ramazzottius varieornatus]